MKLRTKNATPLKTGMNNGIENGDAERDNRAENGRFRKGCRGGPGRPKRKTPPDDPEVGAFAREMAEARERIERLVADIKSGVLTGREAREALRIERSAWRERGKRLRKLELRHS